MKTKQKLRFCQFLRLSGVVLLVGIFVLFGKIIWEVNKLQPQTITVQTSSGNQAIVFSRNISEGEYRAISIKEVPKTLTQVTRVAEDSTTIAQQLARQYSANDSSSRRNITLSLERLITAALFKIEFSEDKQMELYLNESWYGKNIHGIGQAAKVYFNKSVDQLTLAESTILAGLPQRPTQYDLRKGEKDAKNQEVLWFARATHIAELMYKQGVIDRDIWTQTKAAIVALRDERIPDYNNWPTYTGKAFAIRYPKDLVMQTESKNSVTFIQPNPDPSQQCYGQPTCLKVTIATFTSPTFDDFIRNDSGFAKKVLLSEEDLKKLDEHKGCDCYIKLPTQVRGEKMEIAMYGLTLNSNQFTKGRMVLFSPRTNRIYDFLVEGTGEDAFMLFDFGPISQSLFKSFESF